MRIRILVSRHSSFYSPVIAAVTAGFLVEEGLEAAYSVLPKDRTARDLIRKQEADVVQAAVSSNWGPMEKGERDLPVHFAQINQRDGFFLAGRQPDPAFHWKKLEGKSLLADHGGQPLVMLKHAVHCQSVDWNRIDVIDAGSIDEIDAAFRTGRGDYVHQQGPSPQQLERERIGFMVAAVGEAMPAVAFSSLMASRDFLQSKMARAFTRAYRRARSWVTGAPPEEIADREAALFPTIDREALSKSIARYQKLGCWEGDLEITRELYEQALDVFLHSEAISARHPYDDVVVPPPA
jgi:NitT/TauT family transport system substrate-binding protein